MRWLTYFEGTLKKLQEKQDSNEFGKFDVSKARHGSQIVTSKERKVRMIKPLFRDQYSELKRGPQPITLKDCSLILGETLVGKNDVVFDCGSGMGGLTCFLARYVKHVYSCDNRKSHLDITKKNAEKLGLKNITLIEQDIYEQVPKIPQMDLVSLDLQKPADVLAQFIPLMKFGAFVVAYCPQVTQMHEFYLKGQELGLYFVKAIDVTTKTWKMGEKVCRPDNTGLVHTGYLVFFRKL